MADRDWDYPGWKIWVWRTVRGAVWSGAVAVSLVWNTVDLTDWRNALRLVVFAFIGGFGQAFFRSLREKYDTPVVTKAPL